MTSSFDSTDAGHDSERTGRNLATRHGMSAPRRSRPRPAGEQPLRVAVAGASGVVGRALVHAARQAGHEVTALSRATGVDLTSETRPDLRGVQVVIDVTNAPIPHRDEATRFFSSVAANLGKAAATAGVERTVLLSIIGVDQTPDDGYMVAKLAHEQATRDNAPGIRILRSAQLHQFPAQILSWTREGDTALIPDQPIQPVDLAEVTRYLLSLATTDPTSQSVVEIAGPRPEQLPDLVAKLDSSLTVTAGPVSAAVRANALRPGPDAILVGQDFDTWLAQHTAH